MNNEKLRVMKGNRDVSADYDEPAPKIRVFYGDKDHTNTASLFLIIPLLIIILLLIGVLLGLVIGATSQKADDEKIIKEYTDRLSKVPLWASDTYAGQRLFNDWKQCEDRGGTNVVRCDYPSERTQYSNSPVFTPSKPFVFRGEPFVFRGVATKAAQIPTPLPDHSCLDL